MWRCVILAGVLTACGSDDEAGSERACQVTVEGNAGGLDSCSILLCYPMGTEYEALYIAPATNPVLEYTLQLEVEHPTRFAAGTLTLDQLRETSKFELDSGGKRYAARQTPETGTRHADETATLTINKVYPPSTTGSNYCNGSIDGTLTASLVEISNPNTAGETVGVGRLTVTVQLGK